VLRTGFIRHITTLALGTCNDMDYILEKHRSFLINCNKLDQEIAQPENARKHVIVEAEEEFQQLNL
jgi:hypothetical protein